MPDVSGNTWIVRWGDKQWRWQEPKLSRNDRLLESLLGSHQDLLDDRWRLRLSRHDGGRQGALPNWERFAELIHPHYGMHILDLGWSVAQLTAAPRRGEASGSVAVIGDEKLAAALGKGLGPCVSSIGRDDPYPAKAVLVVSGKRREAEARSIQSRAEESKCAVLVWCGETRPPIRAGLVEVLSLARPQEAPQFWLGRFLAPLLGGVDPELSFAMAGAHGPPEDRRRRWLRGAYSSWHVDTSASRTSGERALSSGWFLSINRARPERLLRELAQNLIQPQAERRVQVVVTPGPGGASLERFRLRPMALKKDSPPHRLVEMDLGWTEDIGNQSLGLAWSFRAASADDLPTRIVQRARELLRRDETAKETVVLFVVRHQTLSLHPAEAQRHNVPLTTLDSLVRYLKGLEELARRLASKEEVRLLVHLSLLGSRDEELDVLKVKGSFYALAVLGTLSECIDIEEIRDWLDSTEFTYTKDDLKEMAKLPYDDLVTYIKKRFGATLR